MTSARSPLVVAASAFAAALLTLGAPTDADACGGLFCDGAGPQQVNQAAERIIFSKNADGTVTAIVQILYEGPTDRFGWVLPVPGIPEIDVSSDAAFTTLQTATNPSYQMNTSTEGTCAGQGGGFRGFGVPGSASDLASEDSFNNAVDEPIQVLDSGSAGPYDYVVIQVDTTVDNNVQLALDWLTANNYQATDVGPDLIGPYLEEGYNLLAVRLQKSQDAGAIRPLSLTYETDHPMIPIKLTAVAANDDMGVLVWVLGEAQAVPINYKSLELNDALIDWFQPQAVYNDVITIAANEASGQGFVTEYAQEATLLEGIIFTDRDQQDWNGITDRDWTDNPGGLIDRVISVYSNGRFDQFGNALPWDGLDEAIDQAFPSATAQEKERIRDCGTCAFQGEIPESFSIETFIMAVDDFVVGPMRETQELFDASKYVTRLYTNMSAHEMTLDPSFDFNPDLADVSNQHTANRVIECDSSVEVQDAPYRVTLPSGLVVRGTGNAWPFAIEANEDFPATLAVKEVGTSGQGEIVRDNSETIRLALDRNNAQHQLPKGCACSSADADPDAALLLLGLGFVGLRLRRRR